MASAVRSRPPLSRCTPLSVSSVLLLLSPLLLGLLPNPAQAAVNNWACITPQAKGPVCGNVKCGTYTVCGTRGRQTITCDNCADITKWGAPGYVCNFLNFRCRTNRPIPTLNNTPGKLCTSQGDCSPLRCVRDNNDPPKRSTTGYRCCWRTCPPGVCGGPNLNYTNDCNDPPIKCPEKCP